MRPRLWITLLSVTAPLWALAMMERARKVRLALDLAIDKKAVIQQVLGGLGTVNTWP